MVGGTLGTNVGAGRGAEAFEGGMWQVSRLTGVALAPSTAKTRWLKIKFTQRQRAAAVPTGALKRRRRYFHLHTCSVIFTVVKVRKKICDAPVGEGDVDQRGLGGGGGERPGVLAGRLHISNGQ